MIEVDTKQYLPLHIAEIDEFKNITKTYDKYLSLVWDSLQREELNRVLATMDEKECEQWEKLLSIVINPADSLEDRVNRIRGYHASDLRRLRGNGEIAKSGHTSPLGRFRKGLGRIQAPSSETFCAVCAWTLHFWA